MANKGRFFLLSGILLLCAALGLSIYNLRRSATVGSQSAETVQTLRQQIPTAPEVPDAEEPLLPVQTEATQLPEREMPTVEVDGRSYIGLLQIPGLGLELPVLSQWSSAAVQIAPCRYAGSAYQDNMVICAHNYASQFGPLRRLRIGDFLTFTDVDGTVFSYQVVELETLLPEQTEQMCTGDWDLTLFTCTLGGASRLTVRCISVQP